MERRSRRQAGEWSIPWWFHIVGIERRGGVRRNKRRNGRMKAIKGEREKAKIRKG